MDVKSGLDLPSILDCPFCNGQMLALNDLAGGSWYTCRRCRFSGDSIELYRRCKSISTTEKAVRMMIPLGLISMKSNQVAPADLRGYSREMDKYNTLHKTWREISKDPLSKPWATDLMASLNLWGGHPPNLKAWKDGIGRFIGATTQDELSEMIDFENLKGYFSSRTKAQEMLVTPFYDVPGRIRSLLFIRNGGNAVLKKFGILRGGSDVGLMMLDTLGLGGRSIIALDDPFLALELQRKHLQSSNSPIGLVVWNSMTAPESWRSLASSDVVFCSHGLDQKMLEQGRNLPNARLTTYRNIRRDMDDMSTSVRRMLGRIHDNALSWPEAMCHYLTNVSVPDAYDLLGQLKLTRTEEGQISQCGSKSQKKLLDKLFGELVQERVVRVQGYDIIERTDGLWISKPTSTPEQITDFSVVLSKIVHIARNGDDYVRGAVQFKGQAIPFVSRLADIEKDPGKWVKDKLISGGYGYPIIEYKWEKHLLTISQKLGSPEVEMGYDSVGYDAETQAFIMPKMRIHKGKSDCNLIFVGDVDEMPLSPLEYPMPDLEIKVLRTWTVDDNPAKVAFWAIFSAFVANFIAPALSLHPYKIGVVGGPASAARAIGDSIATTLNLPRAHLSGYAKKDIQAIMELCRRHSCTTLLSTDITRWTRTGIELVTEDPTDIMMFMDRTQGYVYSLRGDWSFVSGSEEPIQWRTPNRKLGWCRGLKYVLPKYLIWLQSNGMTLPQGKSYPHSVLLSLRAYLEDVYPAIEDFSAFDSAAKILFSGALETENAGDSIIRLVQWMLHIGKMKLDHEGSPRSSDVLVDHGSGIVTVSVARLQKIVSAMGMKLPNLGAAMRDLIVDGKLSEEGEQELDLYVPIKKGAWDSEHKRFATIRNRTKHAEQQQSSDP